jgi:hypothetical protein
MLKSIDVTSKTSPVKAAKKKGSLFSFLLDFADLNNERLLPANDAANKLKKGKD